MTDELRFERIINAPPDVVFEAFTTQAGQEAFYGRDEPVWIVESDCDLRVGGLWSIRFGPERDHLHRHRHRFEVLDRPRRLVLASTEVRADGSTFDFATEFRFAEQDSQTLMTMLQTGFPNSELRAEHGRGLPDAFAQFARAVRRWGGKVTG